MKFRTLVAIGALAGLCAACGQEELPYQPKEAYTGKKPTLPAVPTLPNKAKKEGDAYTVWGAMHDLHSIVHEKDFDDTDTTIVGYVVRTNYAKACEDEMKPKEDEHCVPECAVHKTGKADPPECEAPVPTFWIAESTDESDEKKMIPVMGFASNFANMYDFIKEVDKEGPEDAEHMDVGYGNQAMQAPLPNVGGKIKVTGKYGKTFEKGTGPTASNPRTGILTWEKQEWVEPPPEPVVLPGMDL